MPRIVISYRRADRADRLTTRRIWEKLEAKYGEGSAFMDTETMRPGKDFRAQIAEALRGADAMLVMVGEKWLGPRSGQHRINEPTDWVRIEVETALATHVPIFPVLIGKGRMPGVEQLPDSLKDFAYIQAAHVDEEKNFHSDVDQLFDWIDHAIEERRSLQEAKALKEQRALEQRRAIEENARAEQRAEEQRKSIEAQRALERQLALAAEQRAREEQEALAAKRAAEEARALEERQRQQALDEERARAAQKLLDEQKALEEQRALESRQAAERQRALDEVKVREAQQAVEDKKRQDEQRALDEKRERETKPDVPEELVAAVRSEQRGPRRLRHPLALTGIGGAVVLLLGAAVIAGPSIWASLTDSSRKYSLDSDSGGAAVDMPVGGSTSPPPKVATAPVPSTAPPAVAPKAIDSPAPAPPRVAAPAPAPAPPAIATPAPRLPETTGARPPSVVATKARPLGAGNATCGVRAAGAAMESALPSFAPNELTKLRALAVSHDGSRIATAGDDRLIRIWDTANLKLINVLRGHTDAVYSLDFWSGRRLLASAGWDGKVRLWDLDTGGVTVLEDGARPLTRFYAVAFYPGQPVGNLSHVAASGLDGIVRIWNVNDPSAQPRIKDDHNVRMGGREPRPNDQRDAEEFSTARALSYKPTGTGEFVTAGYDGTVRVHRTTGRKVDPVDAHGGKVLSVAYSPDGRRIVSAGSGRDRRDQQVLRLWNSESGKLIRALEDHNHHVVVAIWSPNGNSIASGGGDKSIKIWNPETGKVVLTIDRAHGADIEALAYTPDGNRLISVGEDGLMRIWDLQAGGALLLSAAAHGASDFISYAPPGCYTGSHGSERYLRAAIGNRLNPGATPQAQHIPEGFALIR